MPVWHPIGCYMPLTLFWSDSFGCISIALYLHGALWNRSLTAVLLPGSPVSSWLPDSLLEGREGRKWVPAWVLPSAIKALFWVIFILLQWHSLETFFPLQQINFCQVFLASLPETSGQNFFEMQWQQRLKSSAPWHCSFHKHFLSIFYVWKPFFILLFLKKLFFSSCGTLLWIEELSFRISLNRDHKAISTKTYN